MLQDIEFARNAYGQLSPTDDTARSPSSSGMERQRVEISIDAVQQIATLHKK